MSFRTAGGHAAGIGGLAFCKIPISMRKMQIFFLTENDAIILQEIFLH